MLIERRVDFTHGYRMRCNDCQAGNWLTADDYAAKSGRATMRCSQCAHDFTHGPAAIALRDPKDRALDDSVLPQLAWYHTTKEPNWPAASKPLPEDEILRLRRRPGWSKELIESHRLIRENQALHLGTYEAALGSMLRRMRQKGDEDSKFYLHRVRLRPEVAVEPGRRNENQEPAANITVAEIEATGVDVIRYLNAHESAGSLSLAVVRGAIEATQSLALPIRELEEEPQSTLVEQLHKLRGEVHAVLVAQDARPFPLLARLKEMAAQDDEPLARLARLMEEAAMRPGKGSPPLRVWEAVKEMQGIAADQYLASVSPVVRETFIASMPKISHDAAHEDDLLWLRKFIGLAGLSPVHSKYRKSLTTNRGRPLNLSSIEAAPIAGRNRPPRAEIRTFGPPPNCALPVEGTLVGS